MADTKGPSYVREGYYIADFGAVNKEAEYIRDAHDLNKVYHICKRLEFEDKEGFKVGKINYSPSERKYYCEVCHTWKPLKDFWHEKDGTGTEGHA